jgi:hypothetical protein
MGLDKFTINIKSQFLLLLFIFLFCTINAQYYNYPDTINRKRLNTVIIGASVTYAATLGVLYFAWYKDNPSSSFHFIDDGKNWMGVDKVGHAQTAYTFTNYGYWMLRWAGVNNKKSAWYGGLMGFSAMTVIEILDGFSAEYGASYWDLLANGLGAGLSVSQNLLWEDQRLLMKFSYHPTEYAQYNPEQLGETPAQRILKDYNGHTYWLSASIGSFIRKEHKFPDWICISAGYGAKGMLAPQSNPEFDDDGNPLPHFNRVSQYYLSMDIDWTKIRTNSGFLKFTFKLLSFVKLPFPTLEYNREDGLVGHWIYF